MLLTTMFFIVLNAPLAKPATMQDPRPAAQGSPINELDLAKLAMGGGRWAEAEQALLRIQPSSAEALYLLGETYFHENKPRESLMTFTRAASLRRPTGSELRTVALDYVLLKDLSDADHWITRAVAQAPEDGETWYALGRIKYSENRFAEAEAGFRKALDRMPRSVKTGDNLALTYEALNQPERAIQTYRETLDWQKDELRPSEQPFLNFGNLLADRNQFDEALPLLRRAEVLAPSDPKVHAALGKLYTRRGALPEAQVELELAVTADPNDFSLHYQLGQVYRKRGMAEQAERELKRAAAMESKDRR